MKELTQAQLVQESNIAENIASHQLDDFEVMLKWRCWTTYSDDEILTSRVVLSKLLVSDELKEVTQRRKANPNSRDENAYLFIDSADGDVLFGTIRPNGTFWSATHDLRSWVIYYMSTSHVGRARYIYKRHMDEAVNLAVVVSEHLRTTLYEITGALSHFELMACIAPVLDAYIVHLCHQVVENRYHE